MHPRYWAGLFACLLAWWIGNPSLAAEADKVAQTKFIEITREQGVANLRAYSKIVISRQTTASAFLLVRLSVDKMGHVVEARYDSDTPLTPAEVESALRQIRGWSYWPHKPNGRAVAVQFDVLLYPDSFEARPVSTKFPVIKDIASLKMTLSRSGCYGPCSSYSVEILGNGEVMFEADGYTAVAGEHRDRISQEAVMQIFEAFRAADYFSLDPVYAGQISDSSTYVTSISFDGHTKSVRDYVGRMAEMPASVSAIEHAIDRVARTEKWVKGNRETTPSLKRDGFQFNSPEGATLLAEIAKSSDLGTLQDLLREGTPVGGKSANGFRDREGRTALSHASVRAIPPMVEALLAAGRWSRNDLTDALWWATAAGQNGMMTTLIQQGADPRGRGYENSTILHAAVSSGIPSVVSRILDAGADLEAKDSSGVTPLHANRDYDEDGATTRDHAEVIRRLAKAGANLEAKDGQGATLLVGTWDEDLALALIELGADINAKDESGATVDDTARRWKWKKVPAVLSARRAAK